MSLRLSLWGEAGIGVGVGAAIVVVGGVADIGISESGLLSRRGG